MSNLGLISLLILISGVGTAGETTEGAQLYRENCAVCHGTDGKGQGPAASALKEAPGDLTKLARRNRGKFPEAAVVQKIKGQKTADMPEWGKMLSERRVAAIVRHLEQIQAR